MDINPQRLAFCRDDLGVAHTVDAREQPVEQLTALLGGDLPTLVFDATGSAQSMMHAFDYAAHSGRIVYVGLVKGDISFSDPYFHSHELTLLATRNATAADFAWVSIRWQAGKCRSPAGTRITPRRRRWRRSSPVGFCPKPV